MLLVLALANRVLRPFPGVRLGGRDADGFLDPEFEDTALVDAGRIPGFGSKSKTGATAMGSGLVIPLGVMTTVVVTSGFKFPTDFSDPAFRDDPGPGELFRLLATFRLLDDEAVAAAANATALQSSPSKVSTTPGFVTPPPSPPSAAPLFPTSPYPLENPNFGSKSLHRFGSFARPSPRVVPPQMQTQMQMQMQMPLLPLSALPSSIVDPANASTMDLKSFVDLYLDEDRLLSGGTTDIGRG
eukprot:CAMPEP_0175063404 /NCGR_PEP_ID=MMETSP0052_2-20121109/14738_1 /TAXON_ID=51329 ORGANISM="Polytomella parva, Strain SAG 63-3" /NCGR_SAMPLE_ID=MMETSP0052_2 /ASSEMBLY_ACC=CAM_ASM_000194 /LENGTH=241 /DNA_ID=CAMNT_0016329599 /DNA_START=132 /DNA_END=853 /DNA_ORIENTATION=-